MAERFLYLPSVGLAGCVVAAIHLLGQRKQAWAVTGLVCVALGLWLAHRAEAG